MSYEGQSTDPQGVGDSMMNKPTRGSVSMNINLVGEKESPSEEKGTENGAFVESQTSFRVNEVKDNASNRVEKAGARSRLQVQQKQQQPQGSVVCWEKFLHVESIRVLLVENDECTRHVVTALLRNCNYEVLAAANGLQAWKVLEDLSNHIDIVLTEVVMPYIPGIPLLSKIMSHKTRRNIPVIMMSSHDSRSLVFKCLSKGAVDFLVKPIRKNELKILWQHVWRRCQSSSGSGSESGTQTQKSVKSESSEKSDRGASNDGGNDVNTSLNVGDESDNGSGAQSSWTKKAVEIVSTQATSPMNQVAELPDSTCAQVIRSNAESSDCDRVHIGIAREYQDEKRVDSKVECKDKESETIIHTNAEPKAENPVEVTCAVIDRETKYLLEFNDSSIIKQTCMGQNYPTAEALLNKNKDGTYETSNPQSDGRKSYCPREVANVLDENSEPPFDPGERNIELSLKRLRGIQDTGRPTQDDRYVLHRSEQSAFSRYNACSNFSKVPDGIASRQSISDITDKVAKQEPVHVQAHSTEHAVYLISSDGVGNNLDICSTTKNLPPQQLIINDSCEAISTLNGIHSAFRPVQKDLRYSGQQTTNSVSAKGSQKNLQIQPPHENYHHLRDVERQPSSNDDESSLKRMAEDAPQFGSTNALGGPLDGKGRDYSSSRSISRSNHGSSNAVNASWTNAEGVVGQARRSGSGDSSGSGSGNRVEEDKVAHRIAALSKFRQKKKDRCFAKKVRYQSRKELAEQRPRVRGQFVKHSATDSSKGTSDEL